MKKYICPNCGFRSRLKTRKDGHKRYCKNCGAQVYNSTVVLSSMMRLDIIHHKP